MVLVVAIYTNEIIIIYVFLNLIISHVADQIGLMIFIKCKLFRRINGEVNIIRRSWA